MIAIAEVALGAADEQLLKVALNEDRVVITEDSDFTLTFELSRSEGTRSSVSGCDLTATHPNGRCAEFANLRR